MKFLCIFRHLFPNFLLVLQKKFFHFVYEKEYQSFLSHFSGGRLNNISTVDVYSASSRHFSLTRLLPSIKFFVNQRITPKTVLNSLVLWLVFS